MEDVIEAGTTRTLKPVAIRTPCPCGCLNDVHHWAEVGGVYTSTCPLHGVCQAIPARQLYVPADWAGTVSPEPKTAATKGSRSSHPAQGRTAPVDQYPTSQISNIRGGDMARELNRSLHTNGRIDQWGSFLEPLGHRVGNLDQRSTPFWLAVYRIRQRAESRRMAARARARNRALVSRQVQVQSQLVSK